MFPDWCAKYIGAPYADDGRQGGPPWNCWGLFAAIQARENNFCIADYEGPLWSRQTNRDVGEAARQFAQRFVQVEPGREREFDAILLRIGGEPIHIGCVIKPGFMLHIEKGACATIEDYRGIAWRNRIVAFYRPEYRP